MRIVFLLFFLLCLSPAQARSVFIEELTWTEVRDAIAAGAHTAIYYAGSTEQNGPHMVTGKHNFIARQVAQAIATRLGNALVYPIMPFAPTGDAAARTGHMRYPGSVSLSEASFVAVAREVAASARAAGFKNILLMADHGEGQEALGRLAKELSSQWQAEGLRVLHIGELYTRTLEREQNYLSTRGLKAGGHAALADTSVLMALDGRHAWVRPLVRQAGGDGNNGIEGNARGASARLGRRLLELKVQSALDQIRRELQPSR